VCSQPNLSCHVCICAFQTETSSLQVQGGDCHSLALPAALFVKKAYVNHQLLTIAEVLQATKSDLGDVDDSYAITASTTFLVYVAHALQIVANVGSQHALICHDVQTLANSQQLLASGSFAHKHAVQVLENPRCSAGVDSRVGGLLYVWSLARQTSASCISNGTAKIGHGAHA
jgi:hypothetical protein